MKAVKCPICLGSGGVFVSFTTYPPTTEKTHPCHGCKGTGWIEVNEGEEEVEQKENSHAMCRFCCEWTGGGRARKGQCLHSRRIGEHFTTHWDWNCYYYKKASFAPKSV